MSNTITKRLRLSEGLSLKKNVEVLLDYTISLSTQARELETTIVVSLHFEKSKGGVVQQKFSVEMERVLRWEEIPLIAAEKHKWERVRQKMLMYDYELQDAYLSVAFDTLMAGWEFMAEFADTEDDFVEFTIKKKGPRDSEAMTGKCSATELEPYFDTDHDKRDESFKQHLEDEEYLD